MVDRGLLRIMVKLIMMTVILNAYDVQGSELRLTHCISLSPYNNLWRKNRYCFCIPNKEIETHRD